MEWVTTDSLKETPFFFVETSSSSVEELSSDELEVLRTNPGRVADTSSSVRTKPKSQEPPPRRLTVETVSMGQSLFDVSCLV